MVLPLLGFLALGHVQSEGVSGSRIEASIGRDASGTFLSMGSERLATPLHAKFNQLAVSPGGKRICAFTLPSGPLGLLSKDRTKFYEITAEGSDPVWSPDGERILYRGIHGELRVLTASAPMAPQAVIANDRVHCAAFSPDSRRIAYCTDQGIYISDLEGERTRCVLRGRVAKGLAWHPDGSRIAVAESGIGGAAGKLYSVTLVDRKVKEIAKIKGAELSYSPSGAFLLTKDGNDFMTLKPGESAHKLPACEAGEPTWIGSKKLLLWTKEGLIEWRADTGTSKVVRAAGSSAPFAWAVDSSPELTSDMIFPDPVAKARRPVQGEIRIQGLIADGNPLDAEYTVEVESVTDASGATRFYARPVLQEVEIGKDARITDGANYRGLRSIDLVPDNPSILYLKASALKPGTRLTIAESFAPTVGGNTLSPLKSAPRLKGDPAEYDGVSKEHVIVPMVFPVAGKCNWRDTFLVDRAGGKRRHHGQDLMADKMTPMVACFDGTIYLRSGGRGGHYTIRILGDNGWQANYYHVNNDTPGTDDGNGGDANAFAPGLQSGGRVYAGQFIGYVGDSGNAEGTPPHLHYELWDSMTTYVVNAAPSLSQSQRLEGPAIRLADTFLKPVSGEVRLDGYIRQVDGDRKVVAASLISRTQNGKTKSVVKPESVYVKWSSALDAHLVGNETVQVRFEDLRPGLYVSLVGKPAAKDQAMVPRKIAFDVP